MDFTYGSVVINRQMTHPTAAALISRSNKSCCYLPVIDVHQEYVSRSDLQTLKNRLQEYFHPINFTRDLIKELDKKYEVLLIILFLVFLLFIISEGLLFVSFFWTSFHSLSSPTLGIFPGEGFYLPDPCELTFANTLLLSNAAISLGNAFISLEISSDSFIFFSLFSFMLAWTFISLQIQEKKLGL